MTNLNTRSSLGIESGAQSPKHSLLKSFRLRMQSWLQPVSVGKRQLLAAKWGQLPPDLQTDNQILGKHWIGCGYTMGPAYCSFGCTHCYLPKSSNRVPLVSLELMKEQIVAQRKLLGAGGNLQITGGDVVEAYWRQGKSEELIEILKFATDNELIPMLMTHGQILLENPDYFADLVSKGGLRKVSIHIDTTMAGRPGFPIRSLFCEDQLNPLRDEFVELVLEIRRRTGKLVVAAQTVTVTESNIHSVGDILIWLMSEMKNMDVCRTIIFQPEARVGRTRSSKYPVTPEQVWQQISQSTGQALSRDHLLVGHPDCSSIATLLVRVRDRKVLYLSSQFPSGRNFWSALLKTFGGLGASSTASVQSLIQKSAALAMHPAMIPITIRYIRDLYRKGLLTKDFAWSVLSARVRGFNIVMHNFMSDEELDQPRAMVVQQRLDACAFKGVIKIGGEWQSVSMCEMNTSIRPSLYRDLPVRLS